MPPCYIRGVSLRLLLARLLLAASLLQAVLVYVPLPTWTLWMAHFAALEGCLVGAVTGLAALLFARGHARLQTFAALGVIAALGPVVAVAPVYVREGQPFSITAWVTGARGAEVAVERDLALAPGLAADLYRGRGLGPRPFVLVVHGGSWRAGDKGDAPHVSHALAAAGVTVVDVTYRLAPFPAGVADVKCALGQVRARAGELGIDPDRGALLGRSAGGQMVLLAAYADARVPPSCDVPEAPVRAVVSVYGPTDLVWAHAHPFVPDVVRGTEAVEQYLGGTPADAPEAYRDATPQTWIERLPTGGTVPPTLLIHGTGERCVRPENTTMLTTALAARGLSVRTLLVPLADHGFDIRRGGLGDQLARGVILDFLRETL